MKGIGDVTYRHVKSELIPPLNRIIEVVQQVKDRRGVFGRLYDDFIIGLGWSTIQHDGHKVPVAAYKNFLYSALWLELIGLHSRLEAGLTKGKTFIEANKVEYAVDRRLAMAVVNAYRNSISDDDEPVKKPITQTEARIAIGLLKALLQSSYLEDVEREIFHTVTDNLNLGRVGTDRLVAMAEAAQRHVDSKFLPKVVTAPVATAEAGSGAMGLASGEAPKGHLVGQTTFKAPTLGR